MVDYGYSSIGVKIDTRNLINQIADYHGLKIADFMMLLIVGYAFSTPEGREILLDIGATIQKHINNGMQIDFDDSLNVSESCLNDITKIQDNSTSDENSASKHNNPSQE